jgi:hypothetical protein
MNAALMQTDGGDVRPCGMAIRKRLGAILVLAGALAATAASIDAAMRRPLPFNQPTSIELEPAGTLLLVENNPGRLLRVEPRTGRVGVLVRSVARPYAVVRTPSGRWVRRIARDGRVTTVSRP